MHCPYCHGYEVKDQKIGILANGNVGFGMVKLLQNWSVNLTLFTNGQSTLNDLEIKMLKDRDIKVVEDKIDYFNHKNGKLEEIVFKNASIEPFSVLFARVPFEQKSDVPKSMGCEITDQGFIKIDEMQRTTIDGIYAAGDNSYGLRAVSVAIGAGTKAGAFINGFLIEEEFNSV